MPRIYLDNAATSWPKPQSVYDAVDQYQRELGAPAGRSGYRSAVESEGLLSQTRAALARFIGAKDASSIVFASSGTDALNMAIHGILQPSDHVVTTTTEHNSVLRPLSYLAESKGTRVSYVPCNEQGLVTPQGIQDAIRPDTKIVCVNHGSNVTGTIQQLDEIVKYVSESPALLLVDAAQTLGHMPIEVESLGIDLLAAPGHKGLLGPLGTGLLYIRPGLEKKMRPLQQGGTGSASDDARQPEAMPEKFESGNLNMPGIAGLKAGLEFIESETLDKLAEHLNKITSQLIEGIEQLSHIKLIGPPVDVTRLPVVSFVIDGYDPQDVAAMLDASYRIECRAGFHCAANIHIAIDTEVCGGTVRLSPGVFTAMEEIKTVLQALSELK